MCGGIARGRGIMSGRVGRRMRLQAIRQLNRNGEIVSSFLTKPSGSKDDFEWPHGLAVNEDGSLIYVGFALTGRRVHRYRRI